MSICKACRKEYYIENREHIINRVSTHRKVNKEHCLEVRKKYREENKEKIAARQREYYEENKEYLKQLGREYYEEHADIIKRNMRIYNRNNPQISRRYKQRRRAMESELPHTLTNKEWNSIKSEFNNSCAYCGIAEIEHIKLNGEQLHQEHFIPISKGGEYTHNNIVPSCKNCNGSKSNRDFSEWYPQYKHYDSEREINILEHLGYGKESNMQQLSIF